MPDPTGPPPPSWDTPLTVRWQRIAGPLVTLTVLILLEALVRTPGRGIPPVPLLLPLVGLATFLSGLRAGLVSALFVVLYGLYVFSLPGELFRYTGDGFARAILLTLTAPLPALLVGALGLVREVVLRE